MKHVVEPAAAELTPGWKAFLRGWLPVVLWLGLMFSASTNLGSGQNTSRLIDPLLQWLFPGISHETRIAVNVGVRKCGHVAEYAVLAWLLWRGARGQRGGPAAKWNSGAAKLAVGACAVIAMGDEFFQTFWDQRLGSPLDVLLDTLGGALGISLRWLIGRWRRQW